MLTLLRAENFCQLRAVEVPLGPGVTAVLGENGVGKSNLLACLAWVLSGDPAWAEGADDGVHKTRGTVRFRPLPGSDDEAELARVKTTGKGAAVRRLEFRGAEYVADQAVREQLAGWWGGAPAAVVELAVCRQGGLTELAEARPADRARLVARAVGLDAAEVAWEAFGHEQPPPPPEDPVPLRHEADRLAAELAGAEAALAALPAADPVAAERAAAMLERAAVLHDQWTQADRVRSAAPTLELAVAETGAELAALRVEREQAAALAARRDEARHLELAWQNYHATLHLSAEVGVAAQALHDHERVAPADPGDPPAPDPQYEALHARVGHARVLAALAPGCSCPTCGAHGANLDEAIRVARWEVADHDRLFAAHRQSYNVWAAAEAARVAWATDLAARRAALDARTKSLAAQTYPEPAVPEAEAVRLAAAVGQAADRLVALDRDGYALRRRYDDLVAQLERARAHPDPPGPRPDLVGLRTTARELAAAAGDRARVEERVAALRRALAAAAGRVAKAEGAVRLEAPRRAWYAAAVLARAALHRAAAPAAAAAAYRTACAAAADDWLGRFAARYRLAPDGDWFRADFGDGKTFPVARLSGAEKLLLGLAWRLATLDLGAARFPALVLDEPTYGLDARRMAALTAAVAAWRERAADRQLILVTHDRRLADAADRVVVL